MMEEVGIASRSRLDSLTPLRFLAASAVFLFHCLTIFSQSRLSAVAHLFVQGPTGVSFFFILSGFVLTWSHRPDDTNRRFWRRRFARIYPLQFVSWAIMGLILVYLLRKVPFRGPALASLLLLSPWTPNQQYLNAMNVPCWSLGCEAFFYLLFPFLYRLLQRRSIHERRGLLLGCFLTTASLAAIFHHAGTDPVQYWFIYYFPPVRLLEFVVGMLLALEVRAGTWPRLGVKWVVPFAAGAYVADGWVPTSFMVVAAMVVPFALLIGALAQRELRSGPGRLAMPALLRLGGWSYAFYLLHAPVLVVFAHFRDGPMGSRATLAIVGGSFVVTTAAAAAAHRFVERPAERAIRGPGWRIPAATAGCAAAVVTSLGVPVAYAVARQQVPAVARPLTPAAMKAHASVPGSHQPHVVTARPAGGVSDPGQTGPSSSAAPSSRAPAGGLAGSTATLPSRSATAPIGCQSGLPLGLSTCGGTLVVVPPPRLCAAYRCDGDPATETGYLVECTDGDVSMSGGTDMACSDAGGVESPLYLSPAPAPTPTTSVPPVPSTITAPG